MWAFALKAVRCGAVAFPSVVSFAAFSASCVSLAVCCSVAIVRAVEALCDLVLWSESCHCCIVIIFYIEARHNDFVCGIFLVRIYYDRVMQFFFVAILVVSASERRDLCVSFQGSYYLPSQVA